MKKKIVIIGAGSAMFTQGLVMDLLKKKPGGHEWKLALCDIDPDILNIVSRMVRKMLDAKESSFELEWSVDRKDLLPGADYVVTTIGVGGRRAWEQDVFIPRKYGVFQPVGDTAMPGGISRAMRMVPAMIDIVRDVQQLCPKARFFNYSNPMAVICRAVRKVTGHDMTGLCIGTAGIEWYMADFIGVEQHRVTSLAAGINHCTFIYDFRVDGVDASSIVREKLKIEYPDENAFIIGDRFNGPNAENTTFFMGEPWSWDFYRKYGAFPAPGDRHVSEFFTEYFPHGAYYGKKLGVDAYSFENTIRHGDELFEETSRLALSDEPLDASFFAHFHGEHEQLMDIIHSIETDNRKIFYMNVQNDGSVPNLPAQAVLEIPCVASANGPMALKQKAFPSVLVGFTNRFLSIVELVVEAALQGDRKLMEEAILAGGYIADRNAVRQMVDELLKVHQANLPQFFG